MDKERLTVLEKPIKQAFAMLAMCGFPDAAADADIAFDELITELKQ